LGKRRGVAACALMISILGACRPASPPVSLSPQLSAESVDSNRVIRDSVRARDDSARAHTKRFHQSLPYGSEAQFNPLSLVVNGGYDQLRTSADHRQVFDLPYRQSFNTVWRSLTHADAVIRHYGVRNWLTHEIFPLSTKGAGGAQWYPNYHLHLFGAGATYAETVEWYEQHGTTHPELAAGFTVYAWHVLTEVIENNGFCCEDEDGLTDLAVFDAASIVLWNQEWLRRQFGRTVEFKSWMGQASLNEPHQTIENAYMMAMLRVAIPGSTNWRVINTFGNAFLFGVSRRYRGEYWISPTVGFDPADNPIIDPTTGAKTVTLKPNVGFFVDRKGSLLFSVISKGGGTNGTTINLYPLTRVMPGFWFQHVNGGGQRFGVVSPVGLGIGWFAR
jgi:hypothetical protein